MPTFSGQAIAGVTYTVQANDQEQAMDFLFDMIKEDYTDADFYDVSQVREVID